MPRHPRDSLFLLATATIHDGASGPDGASIQIRVRNIAPGGLMADLPRSVVEGTRVTLDLRGVGMVEGRVVWQDNDRAGIALLRPIDPHLARKPVGQGPKLRYPPY